MKRITRSDFDGLACAVLPSFIMDPCTGLGRFRISNYALMECMIGWCAEKSIDKILAEPDMQERVKFYFEQTELFIDMVKQHTVVGYSILNEELPKMLDELRVLNRA